MSLNRDRDRLQKYWANDCTLGTNENRQPEKRTEYQTLLLNDRLMSHEHMIFDAVSKRDALSSDAMFFLTKVMYIVVHIQYSHH